MEDRGHGNRRHVYQAERICFRSQVCAARALSYGSISCLLAFGSTALSRRATPKANLALLESLVVAPSLTFLASQKVSEKNRTSFVACR